MVEQMLERSRIRERAFSHPLLSLLQQHLLQHISAALTTCQAAKLLGFQSRTYFCEFFRKQTGMTFVVWRRQCRLQHAKRLLIEHPWLPITDIALASGIDPTSFARLFRQHEGIAPRKFRELANASTSLAAKDGPIRQLSESNGQNAERRGFPPTKIVQRTAQSKQTAFRDW